MVGGDSEAAVVMRFVQTVGEPGAILLTPPRPEVGMTLLEESLSDLDVHMGLLLRGEVILRDVSVEVLLAKAGPG